MIGCSLLALALLSSCQLNPRIQRPTKSDDSSSSSIGHESNPPSMPWSTDEPYSSPDSSYRPGDGYPRNMDEAPMWEKFHDDIQNGVTVFYFHVASDSFPLPSYCSYYLTGVFNNWEELEANGAIRMEVLNANGKDYYYALIQDYDDEAHADHRGYQVTMGYNETSGLSKDEIGINWSYKADSNMTYPGLECPIYNAPKDGVVYLQATYYEGYTDPRGFHWSVHLPEPNPQGNVIYDYGVAFHIEFWETLLAWNEAHPDCGITGFAIKGDFNGWVWEPMEDCGEHDYLFRISSVISGVIYQFCIAPLTNNGASDRYDLWGDGQKYEDTVDASGYFHQGNFYFVPESYSAGIFWGNLKMPEFANGTMKEPYTLPSGTIPSSMEVTTLSLSAAGEQAYVYLRGSFRGVSPMDFPGKIYLDLTELNTWSVITGFPDDPKVSIGSQVTDPATLSGTFEVGLELTGKLQPNNPYFFHFVYSSTGELNKDGHDLKWNSDTMQPQSIRDPSNEGVISLARSEALEDNYWIEGLAVLTFNAAQQ